MDKGSGRPTPTPRRRGLFQECSGLVQTVPRHLEQEVQVTDQQFQAIDEVWVGLAIAADLAMTLREPRLNPGQLLLIG